MMKTLKLVLLFVALFLNSSFDVNARDLKPLETWGIKTADYKKVTAYWSNGQQYIDVPPPNCTKPVKKSMKILCSREDFQNIALFTRRFSIYAEENGRKIPIDHKKEYAYLYHTKCKDEDCLAAELKANFYQSLDESGMSYILSEKER